MSKTRDGLRAKVFSGNKEEHQLVINGAEVEVKAPNLGEVMELQNKMQADGKSGIVSLLLNFCYVPGTDEKIFEPEDEEAILAMEIGPWVADLTKIIAKITGISLQMEELEGNSEATAPTTTSLQ